jgi:hypothetical protein
VTLKPLPTLPQSASERDFTQPLETAYRQVGETIDKVVDACNAGLRHVRDTLGPAVFLVQKHLESILKGVKDLVALVTYAFEHHVPVVSMIVRSFRWVTEVKTPMSDLSVPAMEARNPELEYWSGPGASGYWKRMGAQRDAINEVTAKAEYISAWLMKIATANVKFMVDLATTVVEVLSKFVTVSLETLSIVAIPNAVSTLAKEAGGILAKGFKVMAGYANEVMEALGNARDIVSEVGDHTKLPNGQWPQAVYEPDEPLGGPMRGAHNLGPG